MTAELFYFINVVLLSRLILLFEDRPQRPWVLAAMILIQAGGLAVFPPRGVTGVLLLLLVVINGLFGILEHRMCKNKFIKNKNKFVNNKFDKDKFNKRGSVLRISSLVALLLVANVFFSPAIHLQFNASMVENVRAGTRYLLLLNAFTHGNTLTVGMLLAGWLFVLNEANIIIRALLTWVRIGPPAQQQDDSDSPAAKHTPVLLPNGAMVASSDEKKELNTGRIIGLLERTIIYVFVLLNQFTAIAFVLTAKSFARHKALDNREFAEYVLVGTLLSSSVAIFTGMIIRWLLS